MTTPTKNEDNENCVLVLMPTGRDAELVCATLERSRISAEACADSLDLAEKLASGAGAVLLAEEALKNGSLERLIESLDSQPVWSDVPVVLFAGNPQSSEMLLELVGTRLNATIVERPIRTTMLVSAVRGALRARQRQYLARDLLQQLKQADRQKDLFLATLSHELRTPLNSMLGWIHLLRDGSLESADIDHGLEVIERNARMQSEMIADILFVSRVITGKLELKSTVIDISSVVEAAVETVRPSVEEKAITLETHFEADAGAVRGDGDRLQQVLLNLLSNAIKFTPEKGRIDIRVTGDESRVEIEVEDSGQGIDPEILPFVFERFRQADNSYTREVGGLGLGLAIVRHLVELHGGTVGVKSDGENRGAIFTVKLPAAVEAESESIAEAPESPQPPAEPLENLHILLVEDDEDSREMMEVFFAQHDLKVTAVKTAAEALEAIEDHLPDVLISDVGLPGEDGYQLIRKVRRLAPERGGNIPAVALTGYASLQDRLQAVESGYQEHLSKPVEIDDLLALIGKLTARAKHAGS